MSGDVYTDETIALCEQIDDMFWEQHPEGGSHEMFLRWAEDRFCIEHFDEIKRATGLSCLRCGIERILEETD